jgi:hypothetical protein
MAKKNLCVWYNASSGVKRAYDLGLIEGKWVESYCRKATCPQTTFYQPAR